MIWGVVAATLLLLLPALYNGFPLMFADTLEYVDTGKSIWEGLQGKPQEFYGQRSEFYSLLALPLHREGSNLWPVILAHAALTAHLLALCYRTLQPWNGRRFVGLVALLTLLTPAGWTVAWLLPDYTAAGLILAVYLLGPARQQLARAEQVWVGVLLVAFILCHGANLLLALGLCLLPGRKLLLLALGLAVGLQCWIHASLYGRPSLFAPKTPPFLLARWLGDGLIIPYLEEHPESNRFALYPYQEMLKADSNHFLWDPESAYNHLREHHPDIWERVREQQFSLCLAASRAYPERQALILLSNTLTQYADFSADLKVSDYVEKTIPNWYPGAARGFQRSRQHLQQLPIVSLNVAFYLSTLASVWFLWRARRQRSPLAQRLLRTVVTGTVLNAMITGCLSSPDSRYQSRVIWLLPLCALLSLEKQEVVECKGNA